MTTALTDFLLARIADTQATAERLRMVGSCEPAYDPARVLAECEALRRIVELLREARLRHLDDDYDPFVLRALAAIWADHSEFRAEWAP